MPIFDIITINEKHLAKVNSVRKEVELRNECVHNSEISIASFIKWRKYIAKQLRTSKSLTSINVQHIFE